jgi:hypothetical protein
VSTNFSQIVVADFEYEVSEGDLPKPLCMVAYMLDERLQHVRTIRLWRGEFGSAPPLDIGPDTLFVAYSAWAEMACFLVLGWPFPVHVFDQHTAYLAASNVLLPYGPNEEEERKQQKLRKRLPDACKAYGVAGWEEIDKKQMQEDIGAGNWAKYGSDAVLAYCEEDVRMSCELLRRQVRGYGPHRPADGAQVLHWSNYSAKVIARIQARGIPIDTVMWQLVQEHKLAVIDELRRQFDPSYFDAEPIYDRDGGWSYQRFERWLMRAGITHWPRLPSGELDIDSDAFRLMYHCPGVEGLHALRDCIGFILRARLPIGRDGRNRPSLFPLGTTTGRNAHARSPYNVHAGMRSFMVFSPDKIGAYLDWRTQEVGIAAAKSEDPALLAAYRGGDVYHALALSCGFTNDPDARHWKAHNDTQRQHMKRVQLAISYGMGVASLAKSLDRHPLIASGVIGRHQQTYPRFWEWRDQRVMAAMLARRIESSYGWPLAMTHTPNQRALYNFPMQADGAEMLRLAAWRLCEAGLVPSMLVHDGILFELSDREQVEHAKEIMRAAGREVCDGLEIGVDVDQLLVGGARYADKRPVAKQMWATIMQALEKAGALARRA